MKNLKVLDTLLNWFYLKILKEQTLMKTFILAVITTLSFCAEPKAKSQNPSSNITLVLRERVDFEDGG